MLDEMLELRNISQYQSILRENVLTSFENLEHALMDMVIQRRWRLVGQDLLLIDFQARHASIACCRPQPVLPKVLQSLSIDVENARCGSFQEHTMRGTFGSGDGDHGSPAT